MAHFVKPLGANSTSFKQKSNGVLTAMTIGPIDSTKVVVLWGGGKGGEILKLSAVDSKGKRLATTRYLGAEPGHRPDPDGDDKWFLRYELKTVAEGVGTLTAIDKTGMPFARIELGVASGSSAVTNIEQTLLSGSISTSATEKSVTPGSELPFKLPTVPKGSKLMVTSATADVHELLFKMDKNGTTFWVGACVPGGISDFSRAYVFFHPDTITADDDLSYSTFGARWKDKVQRYIMIQGVQLAEARNLILLVPFMTAASRSNQPSTNMFAVGGLATLNSLMDACQTAIGKIPKGTKLSRIGVASFSSGINHLARFSKSMGSGAIVEQVDFDSAFQTKSPHSNLPRLRGARNFQVTQMSQFDPRLQGPRAAADDWLQLDASAWPGGGDGFAIHNNIGNFMFRAMMIKSVL